MQSKIEGVPEGFELLRIGKPKEGDLFIDGCGDVQTADGYEIEGCAILRKIEPPDPGEGWRLLSDDEPLVDGDEHFSVDATVWFSAFGKRVIGSHYRRRLQRYRPFENAKEFEPHRDRWVHQCDGTRGRFTRYTDTLVFHHERSVTWKVLFDTCVFDDDGTPCGVKVE
jgi:hypothetical protein